MAKNKKIGRPKLPRGERQEAVMTVRMSKQDRNSIQAAAQAVGESPSEWIRATLIAAADTARLEIRERKAEESNPALVKQRS